MSILSEVLAKFKAEFPLADSVLGDSSDETIFSIGFDGYFVSTEAMSEQFFSGIKQIGIGSIYVTVMSSKVLGIVQAAAAKHGFELVPDGAYRYKITRINEDTQPLYLEDYPELED